MRLDRLNLTPLQRVLRAMVDEALTKPGKVVRNAIPTSPKDGVQVFLRAREDGGIALAIRRPGGKEHPREIVALARHMGLCIVEGPREERGRLNRPLKGPRVYLVAVCDLDPLIWEGESLDELLEADCQGKGASESEENIEQEGVAAEWGRKHDQPTAVD
jgi:hypothetical protein